MSANVFSFHSRLRM